MNTPSPQEISELMSAFQAGAASSAIRLAQELTRAYPHDPLGWKAMGVGLAQTGRIAEAIPAFQKCLALTPEDKETHKNLGAALQAMGRLGEAEIHVRRALAIDPDYAEGWKSLGVALAGQGNTRDAAEAFRTCVNMTPGDAEAHGNLGLAQRNLGDNEAAIASFRSALAINPRLADIWKSLGITLVLVSRQEEAVAALSNYLRMNPSDADMLITVGHLLDMLQRYEESEHCYRQALVLKPGDAEVHYRLACLLRFQGNISEAIQCYQESLVLSPTFEIARSGLLFLQGYHAVLSPEDYLREARQAAGHFGATLIKADRFARLPLDGRRLRVGYFSGDFRDHAVSYFIEQIFQHHDRRAIEVFAYSTSHQIDAVTRRIEHATDHFVALQGVDDATACQRVREDQIDILIDLSGHAAYNRLGVFAARAAPVQAHYLGYFASTGLPDMDYWIGDDIITPRQTDTHFCEKIWRLPRIWVSYKGNPDAPDISWEPSASGMIRLGSFNSLGKLTPETLSLWARILAALPHGQLLLKTKEFSDPRNRCRILDSFAELGIDHNRVVLRDTSSTRDWNSHMDLYNHIDIALDPVGGVGGGTTTCDALWMGTPLITLIGDRMASRMTASMLHAIGEPDWIAATEQAYLQKVVALAHDMASVRDRRAGQRARMAASPLCDAENLTRCLENAYREMFGLWQQSKAD